MQTFVGCIVCRAAFVRENRAGMYSALSYYLSKVLVELPFQIMFPTAMAGIIVKPINLDGRFVFYALFMTLLNNVGQVRIKITSRFVTILIFTNHVFTHDATGVGHVDWLYVQEQGGCDASYAIGNPADHDLWRALCESGNDSSRLPLATIRIADQVATNLTRLS